MTLPTPPHFSIIVAMDSHHGIGIRNQLPWHLPEDLAYFKQLTTSQAVSDHPNAVVMGRLTYESIPSNFRPLPGRLNIVLSRNAAYAVPQSVITASNLDAALIWAAHHQCAHTFVIGGMQIYKEALQHHHCHRLLITQIDGLYDCDAYFPEFEHHFQRESNSDWHLSRNGEVRYRFTQWIRR